MSNWLASWDATRPGTGAPHESVSASQCQQLHPFFNDCLNPGASGGLQRWVTLRTGGSFPPVPVGHPSETKSKARSNVAVCAIGHYCTTSPKKGRKQVEETSSVGRHRVLFAYLCVPDLQESKTVEPIVPYQQSNQPGSRKRLLEEQFER